MMKKKLYLSPFTESLALQSEGVVCGSIQSTLAITAFDPIGGGAGYQEQHWDVN